MTKLPQQPGGSIAHLRALLFHRILNIDYRIPSMGAAAASATWFSARIADNVSTFWRNKADIFEYPMSGVLESRHWCG